MTDTNDSQYNDEENDNENIAGEESQADERLMSVARDGDMVNTTSAACTATGFSSMPLM